MKSGFLKIIFGKKGQGWSEDSLGIFVLLLCLAIFFSPILFFGKSLYYSDFAFITYPIKSFLAQTFQSGALPFWTPSIDSGTPFMAAFHTGVFYPPSIIFFPAEHHPCIEFVLHLSFYYFNNTHLLFGQKLEAFCAGGLLFLYYGFIEQFFPFLNHAQ